MFILAYIIIITVIIIYYHNNYIVYITNIDTKLIANYI